MSVAQAAPPVHVLKLGGAAVSDPVQAAALAEWIAALARDGARVVVVHGGGERVSALEARLGLRSERIHGLRRTSPEGMEVVTMVLRGQVNTAFVARLVARGVPAVGLSGVDLGLLRSRALDPAALGRVGGPPDVDAERLEALLDLGWVPVVAPICLGAAGEPLNVNADTVAQALAAALGAASLALVSDVPGVLDAAGRTRARLEARQVDELIARAEVRGGMVPKLEAALAAIAAGVARVRIGSVASLTGSTATEVTS